VSGGIRRGRKESGVRDESRGRTGNNGNVSRRDLGKIALSRGRCEVSGSRPESERGSGTPYWRCVLVSGGILSDGYVPEM
jgi:hypothetical protein